MSSHTIQLHRVLRATPARVYRAFLQPDAWVKFVNDILYLPPTCGSSR